MTVPSLTKDFHRLMKRIGRLTDGQASIDNVNWEDGGLNGFGVTIRPNASFYKGGRFKFTVRIPDGFSCGDPPTVWCDTDIYHPNIDRHELKNDETCTNVCLNIFEEGSWNQTHGLEGIVLGILFLMHNPNLRDPLSPEFDCGSITEEEFRSNVNDYMAGRLVDGEFTYSLDFQVINGEFKDLSLIENNVGVAANKVADSACAKLDITDSGNDSNTVGDTINAVDPTVDVDTGVNTIGSESVISRKDMGVVENATTSCEDTVKVAASDTATVLDADKTAENVCTSTEDNIEDADNHTAIVEGESKIVVNDTVVESKDKVDNYDGIIEDEGKTVENETTNVRGEIEIVENDTVNVEAGVKVVETGIVEEEGKSFDDATTSCIENEGSVIGNETAIDDRTTTLGCDVNVTDIDIAEDDSKNDKTTCDGSVDSSNAINTAETGDIVDSEDEDEIMPVKFVVELDDNGDEYFVIDFVGHNNQQTCDTSNTNEHGDTPTSSKTICDDTLEAFEDTLNKNRGRSKSITDLNEIHTKPVLSRSVSVPNDFHLKAFNKHKPSTVDDETGFKGLAWLALDCILTVYKNML